MRHARRLIVTLVGVAFWCVAATTVAYAQQVPAPDGEGLIDPPPPTPPPVVDPPLWKFALVAAIAVLLTVAVIGLITSVRQARPSQPSRMLHA